MSKEIDFSKAPEGATHYSSYQDGDFAYWCKDIEDCKYKYFNPYEKRWEYGTTVSFIRSIKPIPQPWSIYTNDKPLSELSYEQAAELFNAWRGGAKVELLADNGDWCNATPDWSDDIVYRIKQKSERELFVEVAMTVGGLRVMDGTKDVYGRLFDSGKFKLVEQ